jgi:probable phosphoglycerate mutase
MATTLLMVRNASTDWTQEGRLHGRREIGLNATGRAEAEALAERLESVEVAEIVSSPLPRAVETAEALGQRRGLVVARDPRLTDLQVGPWEGALLTDLRNDATYQRFRADPEGAEIGGVESLAELRDRAVRCVDQLLEDNELGANILVVCPATVLRVIVAHHLGLGARAFSLLRVCPASVTALRFEASGTRPRLLFLNQSASLTASLR